MAKTKAIICDLDGTLSINDHGRSFFEADDCDKDSLNHPVALVLKWASLDNIKIIYLSGRVDKYQEPTLRFLSNHNFSYLHIKRKDSSHLLKCLFLSVLI